MHQCQKYNVVCLHNWTYDLCIFVISSKTGFVDIVPLCCKPLIYNTSKTVHVVTGKLTKLCTQCVCSDR